MTRLAGPAGGRPSVTAASPRVEEGTAVAAELSVGADTLTPMAYDVARVRGLYPSLADGWIRLDPQAGGQIPDTVATAVSNGFRAFPSAPGGAHPSARKAAAVVDAARLAVADLLGCRREGVALGTDRATLVGALVDALGTRLWLGGHLVVSRLDDEANLAPWLRVSERFGGEVRWLELDIETGELPESQFGEVIGVGTSVVVLALASSTLGVMTAVRRAADAVHAVGGLLVVDASAAAAHVLLDIEHMAADVVIVSAERWGGPRVSALGFASPALLDQLRNVSLDPAARGVARLEQETVQVALLAGLVASVDHLAGLDESASGTRRERLAVSLDALHDYQQRLLFYLLESLGQLPLVSVLGADGRMRVPAVSFTVTGVPAARVAARLADNGICALADVRDRALEAIGVAEVGGAVTIGLGPYSTPYEVDQLARALGSLG